MSKKLPSNFPSCQKYTFSSCNARVSGCLASLNKNHYKKQILQNFFIFIKATEGSIKLASGSTLQTISSTEKEFVALAHPTNKTRLAFLYEHSWNPHTTRIVHLPNTAAGVALGQRKVNRVSQ